MDSLIVLVDSHHRVWNSWGSHAYVHDGYMYQQKGRLSHYQNSTSFSSLGSILKNFYEGTGVGQCEGCTFG